MAAAPETHVRFLGQGAVTVRRKRRDDPSYLRIHGELILSRGSRGDVGPRAELLDETDQLVIGIKYPAKVFDASFFMSVEDCSKLIHHMLARVLLTSEHHRHLNLAVAISHCVAYTVSLFPWSDDIDIDVDVTIPELRVCLVRREPEAPLLACTDDAAETGAPIVVDLAGGRNHCGEPCPICLSNLETEGEASDLKGTVRLRCSHAFHSRCILPWFHRAITCPICRLAVMDCFPRGRDEELIHSEGVDEEFL